MIPTRLNKLNVIFCYWLDNIEELVVDMYGDHGREISFMQLNSFLYQVISCGQ